MTDVPAAIAKIVGTTLASTNNLSTPQGLGQVLATAFYVDRTVAGGFLADKAQQLLAAVLESIEALGCPVKHAPQYVWYLMCHYGEMSAKATTPTKLDIIHAAFFSEFSEEFAKHADVAMFRGLIEKLDYNEACFLAGAWSATLAWETLQTPLHRDPEHDDFHIARSLASKGELYVALVGPDVHNPELDFSFGKTAENRLFVVTTPALGRFIRFVGLEKTPALHSGDA